MKPAPGDLARRDRIVAGLLRYGTWFASVLIAVGMLLTTAGLPWDVPAFPLGGHGVVKAGVAVFILLPIARVALMLAIFLRERDHVYSAIAALVLAIIATGVIVSV